MDRSRSANQSNDARRWTTLVGPPLFTLDDINSCISTYNRLPGFPFVPPSLTAVSTVTSTYPGGQCPYFSQNAPFGTSTSQTSREPRRYVNRTTTTTTTTISGSITSSGPVFLPHPVGYPHGLPFEAREIRIVPRRNAQTRRNTSSRGNFGGQASRVANQPAAGVHVAPAVQSQTNRQQGASAAGSQRERDFKPSPKNSTSGLGGSASGNNQPGKENLKECNTSQLNALATEFVPKSWKPLNSSEVVEMPLNDELLQSHETTVPENANVPIVTDYDATMSSNPGSSKAVRVGASPKEFKLPKGETGNGLIPTSAEVVGDGKTRDDFQNATEGYIADGLCPYHVIGQCRFGNQCILTHGATCEYCGRGCLHPENAGQRERHSRECIAEHERDMELSFAIARSNEKTCGVCMEVVMEKVPVGEQRFGILPSCNHCFCLACIRKWRQAKQFENKIIRACPVCRVTSDFVCPSRFWVDAKEEKEKLISDYKIAMSKKPCRYYKNGNGACAFGNKCFYLHALPDGTVVDVGPPRRRRRQHDYLIDANGVRHYRTAEELEAAYWGSDTDSEFTDSDFDDLAE